MLTPASASSRFSISSSIASNSNWMEMLLEIRKWRRERRGNERKEENGKERKEKEKKKKKA